MFIWRWLRNLFRKRDQYPIPVRISVEVEIKGPEVVNAPIELDFKFIDSSHHHPYFSPKDYPSALFINKCTQGVGFVDKTHAERKIQCAQHGITYGGYHFYECKKNPMAQASHYIKTHGEFIMAPIADYETMTGQNEEDLVNGKENFLLFLNELERVAGKKPWVYLNYSAAKRMRFDERFGKFPAWFARYNPFLGEIPHPWTLDTTAAWQFTESGEFGGLKGGNDVNIYYARSKALD